MKRSVKLAIIIVLAGTAASMAASAWAFRASTQTLLGPTVAVFPAYQATSLSSSQLINPEELVKILQSPKGEKPLMIQVGSHVLYEEAHIPGSEYIGPASREIGVQQLRVRVQPLPERSSSSSTAAVARGTTARTSSPPPTRCKLWDSPTSRCFISRTTSVPIG